LNDFFHPLVRYFKLRAMQRGKVIINVLQEKYSLQKVSYFTMTDDERFYRFKRFFYVLTFFDAF